MANYWENPTSSSYNANDVNSRNTKAPSSLKRFVGLLLIFLGLIGTTCFSYLYFTLTPHNIEKPEFENQSFSEIMHDVDQVFAEHYEKTPDFISENFANHDNVRFKIALTEVKKATDYHLNFTNNLDFFYNSHKWLNNQIERTLIFCMIVFGLYFLSGISILKWPGVIGIVLSSIAASLGAALFTTASLLVTIALVFPMIFVAIYAFQSSIQVFKNLKIKFKNKNSESRFDKNKTNSSSTPIKKNLLIGFGLLIGGNIALGLLSNLAFILFDSHFLVFLISMLSSLVTLAGFIFIGIAIVQIIKEKK